MGEVALGDPPPAQAGGRCSRVWTGRYSGRSPWCSRVRPGRCSGWGEVQQSMAREVLREEPMVQHGELAAVDQLYSKVVLKLFNMCVVALYFTVVHCAGIHVDLMKP